MKKFLLIPMLLLAGCTTNQMLASTPVIGNVCQAAEKTFVDEKVVYAANALYNVPAQAYVMANRRGKISPGLKLQLKPMLKELYGYVGLIKAAQGTVNCDFNSMKALQVRVLDIIPKG